MGMNICNHCIQRYTFDDMSGDFVHQCDSGNPVLDQEDILVFSKSVDEFGQTVQTGRQPNTIVIQGTSNKLQGTMAGVLGGFFGGVTVRGNPAQTMRQRQHFEYIENPSEKDL